MAEVDPNGNVNVSKFGSRLAGVGGFVNISQNAKKVVFLGTFTAGALKTKITDRGIEIISEGKFKRCVEAVEQVSFSGDYAIEKQKQVIFITERAVFQLTPEGLILQEIAPGIDLQKDI